MSKSFLFVPSYSVGDTLELSLVPLRPIRLGQRGDKSLGTYQYLIKKLPSISLTRVKEAKFPIMTCGT